MYNSHPSLHVRQYAMEKSEIKKKSRSELTRPWSFAAQGKLCEAYNGADDTHSTRCVKEKLCQGYHEQKCHPWVAYRACVRLWIFFCEIQRLCNMIFFLIFWVKSDVSSNSADRSCKEWLTSTTIIPPPATYVLPRLSTTQFCSTCRVPGQAVPTCDNFEVAGMMVGRLRGKR